ncbi:hypothetical protein E8E12_001589 [Didymella heteroderae]|uniref:Uncharacterized protein n=1 Tax=Didymella heteroderae TaxID=1769908 RepID=A0A9P4X003_9PLEO|nr:hypothetical protein E8E12_001589 [Didymella heteroderae]
MAASNDTFSAIADSGLATNLSLVIAENIMCAYPISDIYAPTPRFLYYSLLFLTFATLRFRWLSNIFLTGAVAYAASAAIHAFIIVSSPPQVQRPSFVTLPFISNTSNLTQSVTSLQLSNNCFYPCFNTSQVIRQSTSLKAVVTTPTTRFAKLHNAQHNTNDEFKPMIYVAIIVFSAAQFFLYIVSVFRLGSEAMRVPIHEPHRLWQNRTKVGQQLRSDILIATLRLIIDLFAILTLLAGIIISPLLVVAFICWIEWYIRNDGSTNETINQVGQWSPLVKLASTNEIRDEIWRTEMYLRQLKGQLEERNTELKGIPVSTEFWTAEDIDEARVPPLHSVLFGAFRVVDSKWSDYPGTSVKTSRAQYSCIDLAFGSDDGFIAGVHRFSVSEVEGSTNIESKRLVSINFDHFSCNPKENKLLGPSVLQTFHLCVEGVKSSIIIEPEFLRQFPSMAPKDKSGAIQALVVAIYDIGCLIGAAGIITVGD